MKSLKWIALSVTGILFLSGCYTQLQYSQRMHRITDYRSPEYYQDDEQDSRTSDQYAGTEGYEYEEDYAGEEYADDEYIPVYYKDYQTAAFYNSYSYSNPFIYGTRHYRYVNQHALNTAYEYGYLDGFHDGSGYIGPVFYSGYYGIPLLRPFSYDWYLVYGPYYRAGVSFGFGWYHHFWYRHRFGHHYAYLYGPHYWPYYHGNFITYNFYYFGNSGNSYTSDVVSNRRYGPRSIGTDRVANSRSRSVGGTRSTVRRSANTSYDTSTRTRSIGRNRGTVTRSTSGTTTRTRSTGRSVKRSRNGSDNGSSGRTGNGSVQRSRSTGGNSSAGSASAVNRSRDYDSDRYYRVRSANGYVLVPRSRIDRSDYRINTDELRSRMRNSKVQAPPPERRSSFWDRLRNYNSQKSGNWLKQLRNSNSSTRFSIPNRSVKSRSTGTSVKSRSSSSSSRSRGSSSGSNKRSSGSKKSSSDRNRGGN